MGISNLWSTTFLMSVITQIGCPFSFINMCLLLDLSSRNYEVWGSCRAFKEIQWRRLTVFHLPAEHQGRRSGPQLASCRHRCDLWQRLEPPPGLCESVLWLERSIASLQLSSDLSFLTSIHPVLYVVHLGLDCCGSCFFIETFINHLWLFVMYICCIYEL